jgi:hypothetical protein
VYVSDLIREEEKGSPDEAYNKPVSREGGQVIIDPAKELMMQEVEY